MKILDNRQCEKFLKLAVTRTAKYLQEYHLKGMTLGISGGIDSSVVAVIGLKTLSKLKKAGFKLGYEYLFLDCDSDSSDYQRAQALAKKFAFKLKSINLADWYQTSPLLKIIPSTHPKKKIAEANIKCRLRMISLYNSTQLHDYLCLDTDDLSEKLMGFWTRHGDEGDLKIIQELTKTEVYDLGEFLKIPEVILNSHPGDGLGVTPRNLAKEQLGLDYLFIEYIISRFSSRGFNYNGPLIQLKKKKYQALITEVTQEIKKPRAKILKVLNQALKTAYKRKYGESVATLVSRFDLKLPEIGTKLFNKKYLAAIKKYHVL